MTIATAASDAYNRMRQVTLPSKQEYAKLWGCELIDYRVALGDDLAWHRPRLWKCALESVKPGDYIWFLGADAMIMNQTKNWRHLVGDCNMVIGMDVNGINTDSFFLCHSVFSLAMLDRTMELKGQERNEQDAMNRALGEMICDVCIKPQRYLNSYSYSVLMNRSADKGGDYKPGDFVFHAPCAGLTFDARLDFLRMMATKIVR